MAQTVNLQTVLNSLHNLMGHRVNPGGTDDDYKRYIQASFDYCWRYYRWGFSLSPATVATDGLLPTDFDYDGYRDLGSINEVNLDETLSSGNTSSAIIYDTVLGRYKLSPAVAGNIIYQRTPPTLTTDTNVPFPSPQVIALGATIYAKMGENPTRADIQQEWDLFHSELDRLVGRADNAKPRSPRNYHSVRGGGTGYVG